MAAHVKGFAGACCAGAMVPFPPLPAYNLFKLPDDAPSRDIRQAFARGLDFLASLHPGAIDRAGVLSLGVRAFQIVEDEQGHGD